MLTWFIEWTTRLNETNHLAYALVTVAVMALMGISIAMIAELILKLVGVRSNKADQPHH
jgi:hypothetical protein